MTVESDAATRDLPYEAVVEGPFQVLAHCFRAGAHASRPPGAVTACRRESGRRGATDVAAGERVRKLPSTGVEDSKIGELLARPKKTVKCFAPSSIRGCPRMTSRLARDAGARHQARLDDRGPEQRHRFRRIRTRATGEAVGSCAPARRDFLNALLPHPRTKFRPTRVTIDRRPSSRTQETSVNSKTKPVRLPECSATSPASSSRF